MGCLGSLWRLQPTLPDAPDLTHPVADRWKAAWGADGRGCAGGARRTAAARPDACRSLANRKMGEELEGTSLAPGHVRLARGSAIEMLPGYADGAWWVQDLAASLPARLLGPGNRRTVARPVRRTGRQDDATGEPGLGRHRARQISEADGPAFGQSGAHRAGGEIVHRRCAELGTRCALRRCAARCAVQRDRHLSPPSRCAAPDRPANRSPNWPNCNRRCSTRQRQWSNPAGCWSMPPARSNPKRASSRPMPSSRGMAIFAKRRSTPPCCPKASRRRRLCPHASGDAGGCGRARRLLHCRVCSTLDIPSPSPQRRLVQRSILW
jgi:hypothetical protein